MTNELATLAAEVATLTIQHMADEAGLTFGETVAAIAQGGNAAARFTAYIKTAQANI
jgi:hypothetical protein